MFGTFHRVYLTAKFSAYILRIMRVQLVDIDVCAKSSEEVMSKN